MKKRRQNIVRLLSMQVLYVFYSYITEKLLAPPRILIVAAHRQPQFPCLRRKKQKSKLYGELSNICPVSLMRQYNQKPHSPNIQ